MCESLHAHFVDKSVAHENKRECECGVAWSVEGERVRERERASESRQELSE